MLLISLKMLNMHDFCDSARAGAGAGAGAEEAPPAVLGNRGLKVESFEVLDILVIPSVKNGRGRPPRKKLMVVSALGMYKNNSDY
jgi:hypothetical protein